jgi:hypothetical protein
MPIRKTVVKRGGKHQRLGDRVRIEVLAQWDKTKTENTEPAVSSDTNLCSTGS